MFKGQFQHNIDDKGRLVLPTKFRDKLGEGAVITFGFDGCLTIYTAAGWENYQNQLLSMPITSQAVRKHLRVLTGSASDVELDKSGRVKIPDYLMKDAGISKECTIVGVGSVIEVWATDRWLKELESGKEDFEEIAEQLTGYGNYSKQ